MGHVKVLEILVSVLTLIFLFWQTAASTWIIAIAAIVLLLHALCCKCFHSHEMDEKPARRRK